MQRHTFSPIPRLKLYTFLRSVVNFLDDRHPAPAVRSVWRRGAVWPDAPQNWTLGASWVYAHSKFRHIVFRRKLYPVHD